jgi:hypothetical protein
MFYSIKSTQCIITPSNILKLQSSKSVIIRKKLICEHEFYSAFEHNPNKTIVYVTEGNTDEWDEAQQNFLYKIQQIDQFSYDRGARVTTVDFKAILRTNLTEKIAQLIKK